RRDGAAPSAVGGGKLSKRDRQGKMTLGERAGCAVCADRGDRRSRRRVAARPNLVLLTSGGRRRSEDLAPRVDSGTVKNLLRGFEQFPQGRFVDFHLKPPDADGAVADPPVPFLCFVEVFNPADSGGGDGIKVNCHLEG